MSDKRRGLGRGLGALIPSGPTPTRPGAAPGAVQTRGAIRPPVRPIDVFFDQRPDDEPEDVAAVSPGDAPGPTFHVEQDVKNSRDVQDDGADAGIVTDVISETVLDDHPTTEAADVSGHDDGDLDGLLPVPGARFAEIPVGAIRPNPRQPRTVFDEDDLAELVHSIQEIGVLQPIVVRPIADADQIDPAGTVEFELVMGERRWRAATEAGLATVPAIVRETADDDLLRDALLENLHRSQLNPLEEAAAYAQLLEDFGCTHEELAGRIGRSRPQISNTLRLMKLPPLVQRRVAAGVLSAGHARALLALEDGGAMERLAQRIVAEGLSVRAVEELIALGDADAAPRRRNPPRDYPELDRRAAVLADRLDTRVKISMGRSRGRLTVDFAGVEDLDRILRLLEQDASRPAS